MVLMYSQSSENYCFMGITLSPLQLDKARASEMLAMWLLRKRTQILIKEWNPESLGSTSEGDFQTRQRAGNRGSSIPSPKFQLP